MTRFSRLPHGPDGGAFVALDHTPRQRPRRYRGEHLALAFIAGAVSTILAVVAMIGAVLP